MVKLIAAGNFLLITANLLIVHHTDADQLLLVHAAWRHGDRSPTGVCRNDKANAASTWRQGFGQLSPIGMKQHYELGSMIYDEYVKKQAFLSETYQSNEIYIRSTDVNRTIISAMSNMIGMYSNRSSSTHQILSPNSPQWPNGFVPIPVHAVEHKTDRIGAPGVHCKRDDYLFDEMTKCPKVVDYMKSVRGTLQKASSICGNTLDIFNVWIASGSWFIEKIHNRTQIFNESEYLKLKEIDEMAIDFSDGINLSTCEGLNLHVLIPQVRGGPMLWDIIHRIDFKLRCMQPENVNSKECSWINGLKYYVYSAHDDTLAALLAALGAKHKLLPHGYPEYASAVIIELWSTKKGPQIRMKYHRNSNEVGFEDATSAIQGCSLEQGYCSYADFKRRSEPYNPKNITKLCDDVPGNYEKKKRNYVMNRNQDIHWMVENDADKIDPNEKPFNDFSPKFAAPSSNAENELIFLHMIWRHGDRTPKWLCKNDPNNASTWVEGLGQLTPTGMEQQQRLGSLIFNEYAVKQKLISQRYESNQIYLRSTDVNRTLLSAVSNLVGMYFNRPEQIANLDYPSMKGWPNGYVPVAVHTLQTKYDHVSDKFYCPRRDQLYRLIQQSKEAQNVAKQYEDVLQAASKICGSKLDVFSVFNAVDACTTEAAHNRSCIFPDDLFKKMRQLDIIGQDFRDGRMNQSIIDGIDVSTEIPRLDGGPLLWDIIHRMEHKVLCSDPLHTEHSVCRWMKHLKYFAYSAHDNTLQSLLATLDARKALYPSGGIPQFAAAMAIELWRTPSNDFIVKVKFNRGHANNTFFEITNDIKGCPKTGECMLDVFKCRSLPYNPRNIVELCNTPLKIIQNPTPSPTTRQTSESSIIQNSTPSPTTRQTSTTSSANSVLHFLEHIRVLIVLMAIASVCRIQSLNLG